MTTKAARVGGQNAVGVPWPQLRGEVARRAALGLDGGIRTLQDGGDAKVEPQVPRHTAQMTRQINYKKKSKTKSRSASDKKGLPTSILRSKPAY